MVLVAVSIHLSCEIMEAPNLAKIHSFYVFGVA